MHFTREPIIETVIAAKDGHKLVLKNSKISGQEEFQVDAVELVSFGQALFFRSLERPRIFMVPVGDYEVLEAKESRTMLKAVPADKVIKIAGGKESGPKEAPREREHRERGDRAPKAPPAAAAPQEDESEEEAGESAGGADSGDRRKRRRRRRGGRQDREERPEESRAPESEGAGPDTDIQEVQEAAQTLKARGRPESMIPPPPALISETLARYREGRAPKATPSQGEGEVVFFAEAAEDSFEDQPQ